MLRRFSQSIHHTKPHILFLARSPSFTGAGFVENFSSVALAGQETFPTLQMDLSYNTSRLSILPWSTALTRHEMEIFIPNLLTPAVTEQLPWAPVTTPQEASTWLEQNIPETNLAVIQTVPSLIEKEDKSADTVILNSKSPIGILFVSPPDSGGAAHVGYAFIESSWGKGFATEVLFGLIWALSHASSTSPALKSLSAGATSTHLGSIRVLSKAGFEIDETVEAPPNTTMLATTLKSVEKSLEESSEVKKFLDALPVVALKSNGVFPWTGVGDGSRVARNFTAADVDRDGRLNRNEWDAFLTLESLSNKAIFELGWIAAVSTDNNRNNGSTEREQLVSWVDVAGLSAAASAAAASIAS